MRPQSDRHANSRAEALWSQEINGAPRALISIVPLQLLVQFVLFLLPLAVSNSFLFVSTQPSYASHYLALLKCDASPPSSLVYFPPYLLLAWVCSTPLLSHCCLSIEYVPIFPWSIRQVESVVAPRNRRREMSAKTRLIRSASPFRRPRKSQKRRARPPKVSVRNCRNNGGAKIAKPSSSWHPLGNTSGQRMSQTDAKNANALQRRLSQVSVTPQKSVILFVQTSSS